MSTDAALLDLVLYTHQQVESDMKKIKDHPEYFRILSLETLTGAPKPQSSISASVSVLEQSRSMGSKIYGKETA